MRPLMGERAGTAESDEREPGGLGLDQGEVRLVPHNPHWVPLGRRECETVSRLLGDAARAVVHVGSTSVPGLEAKPILDIAASVDDDTQIDDVVARLSAGGEYSYEGDKHDEGGLLFVRGHGPFRTVHVHVVGAGSQAWVTYLRFRRLLMDDPAARERYQSAKRGLARQYPMDRLGYTTAKSVVVEDLLASAG
jgi:GrpB-like predicted nucleotidyltransferase (UPF0157 family)